MIVYPIGASPQLLVFTDPVLLHFEKHRQRRWWHREAGGQLFARFELPRIIVEEATGPRRSDWRTRYSYHPNRAAEQREITERHARGLHFVGDWHTHPEDVPRPSSNDTESIQESVRQSRHGLNGFVLTIVGRAAFPGGLFVSLFSDSVGIPLEPEHSSLVNTSPDRGSRIAVRSVTDDSRTL